MEHKNISHLHTMLDPTDPTWEQLMQSLWILNTLAKSAILPSEMDLHSCQTDRDIVSKTLVSVSRCHPCVCWSKRHFINHTTESFTMERLIGQRRTL